MHYFLCVRIDGFYARELQTQRDDLEHKPLVVHRAGRVIDASDEASIAGVGRGMPLQQAKALLASGVFIQHEPDAFRAAQKSWLDLLVPFSDAIEPLNQDEAIIDLSAHPRPSEIADVLVSALANHQPRVLTGAGSAKWTARLALESSTPKGKRPDEFLRPLPTRLLTPASERAREKLVALGYPTIGEVASVPFEVLRRHFREEAYRIHLAANGRLSDPVQALYPERCTSGFHAFEGGTECSETLAAGVGALCRTLGERIALEERETTEVALHLEFERGVSSFQRTFSKPVRCARSLTTAATLMLDGKATEPVYGIRLTLPSLVRGKKVQHGLFTQAIDRNAVRLSRAVTRIHALYGERSIRCASDFEIPRRIRLLKELGGLVGWC
ncbi:hypothetical protein EON81_01785 [bacterium]|nr:MAG: hypothetical protein EON81_01785 [bacterium]